MSYQYHNFVKSIGVFLCTLLGLWFAFYWIGRADAAIVAYNKQSMETCLGSGEAWSYCEAIVYGNN